MAADIQIASGTRYVEVNIVGRVDTGTASLDTDTVTLSVRWSIGKSSPTISTKPVGATATSQR